MTNILAVLIDGIVQLEFDRNKSIPTHQEQFLNNMDAELMTGIVVNGQKISQPDLYQRAQFVALNLVNALRESNDSVAAAMCTYLATRLPELKQVKVELQGEQMSIDLVFDENYTRQVNVEFKPLKVKPPEIH